ncbi:hypothetical protein MMC22_006121 [Lobaria immixta]|nr:hypothetical protein [Lobaria immixta]
MPPATHHVIALISGGKDSFLALLHCLVQNHHVVALANLHPPSLSSPADPTTNSTTDTAPDPDPNSHMYQTVGHTLIPLYARALSIPLYRGEILGTAVNSQRDYHPSSSSSPPPTPDPMHLPQEQAEPADETESLIPLLRRIQRAHPSATAIVSGAILSNYQRTRIESVALRLGLVPLAPLWQYPFLPTPVPRSAGLLEDVAAVGLEARIVKVASGGLDEGFLWEDLRDAVVRRRVESGVRRFGGSVLGEGGEFETLVVDGPEDVFHGRIELEETEWVVRRGEGGEAYLEFTGGRVVQKEEDEEKKPTAGDNSSGKEGWRRRLRVPGLWDERFKALVGKIKEPVLLPRTRSFASDIDDPNVEYHPIPTEQPARPSPLPDKRIIIIPQPHRTHTRCTLTICNLTSFHSPSPSSSLTPLASSSTSSSISAAIHQARSIISHLRTLLLRTHHNTPLSPSGILFTTLLLRHMSHFSVVNAAYAELFADPDGGGGKPIPPARVTIGCGDRLPAGVEVAMSVVVARGECTKDGLHVQSRSSWAPANIGPYSQAVAMPVFSPPSFLPDGEEEQGAKAAPAVVYVAGQIPLIPASMDVLGEGEGFGAQTCLALQHGWRVGVAMRVQWWMGAVAFLTDSPPLPETKGPEKEVEMETRARTTWSAWKNMHDPTFFSTNAESDADDGYDAWDRKYGQWCGEWAAKHEEEPQLPDFGLVHGREEEEGEGPGFFAVQVDELPRGCAVEWQVLGARDVERVHLRSFTSDGVEARTCTVQGVGSISYVSIPRRSAGVDGVEAVLNAVVRDVRGGREGGGLVMTVYDPSEFEGVEWGLGGDGDEGEVKTALGNAHVIPCRAVWGPEGMRLAAGVVVQIDM